MSGSNCVLIPAFGGFPSFDCNRGVVGFGRVMHQDGPVSQTMKPSHSPHSVVPLTPHPDKLYVVTCVNNYNRYRTRYRLYRSFKDHVDASGAVLHTIECQLGSRPFEVTSPDDPTHIQVRTTSELWHKENLMNLAAARLPAEARYIAFVDADFTFIRPDWAQETIQQLQHFQVVQMFSSVGYLGPDESQTGTNRIGFVEAWSRGIPLRVGNQTIAAGTFFHPHKNTAALPQYGGDFGPPGGAWAFRRTALDALGGLLDFGILGSSDYFMALGLVGCMQHRIPHGYSEPFKRKLLAWQDNAERVIRRNIGVVPGTMYHHFHGNFKLRHYSTREQILIRNRFNPDVDLRRNTHGVYELADDGTPRHCALRDDIRSYFRVRNEDSIEP